MRYISSSTLAAALGSIGLLTACAGGSPPPTSLVPSSSFPAGALHYGRNRGSTPFATCNDQRGLRMRTTNAGPIVKSAAIAQRYVYVADLCVSTVDVLHAGNYNELGSITNELYLPNDAFVDSKGDLYVANFGDVTEYASGNWSSPSFTYSANMNIPSAVTADTHGNVYEADNGNESANINEYYQNRNVSIASCNPINNGDQGYINGIAVDSHNDVFATVYDLTAGTGKLVEFVGGLNNCGSLTVLPLPAAYAGDGIALDNSANLVIADGTQVDVVDAPSYNTVNATLATGFSGASNIHLNKSNKLAFITDIFNDTVTVVRYPSGAIVAVLGTGNGLSQPRAAVEQPNAVY
jgi:hypothetical protein